MKSVLYVDDDRSMRALVALVLGKHYEVTQAESAQQALERLSERPFDLMISDINMPHMDGLELLAAIQNAPALQNNHVRAKLPVLLMSAENDPQVKARGKQLGACGWIHKPFNPQKLLETLEKLLADSQNT